MIKVAGIWESGWTVPINEYDVWVFPLRDFGVKIPGDWYMTPVSGINRKKVIELPDMRAVVAANPQFTPVYVSENSEMSLYNFEHPENALYILGNAGVSPKMGDISVSIDTQVNKGLLWPHQAISIVLYDRLVKEDHMR